jgi:uncharacterized protein YigA (DUF484 family)
MNKQSARGVELAPISEHAIAEYLERNPDFFDRHATLLTKLKLTHHRGLAAVSLIERQVQALREKNEGLEKKLREFVEVARGNDALAAKIHRLACRLIAARNAATLLDNVEVSLREDFGAAEWLLLLAPSRQPAFAELSSRHIRLLDAGAPEWRMFESLFEAAKPRCGQIRDSQRDFLFGPDTVEIGSAALVPLGRGPRAALLAIGSPDSERFHPAMSTDFLARIGELLSEALDSVGSE